MLYSNSQVRVCNTRIMFAYIKAHTLSCLVKLFPWRKTSSFCIVFAAQRTHVCGSCLVPQILYVSLSSVHVSHILINDSLHVHSFVRFILFSCHFLCVCSLSFFFKRSKSTPNHTHPDTHITRKQHCEHANISQSAEWKTQK